MRGRGADGDRELGGDTYLRTYRGALDAARVVQFLLMDKLFPRSVFHALRQAETCLIELDNRPTVRIGAKAEALRLLGRRRGPRCPCSHRPGWS